MRIIRQRIKKLKRCKVSQTLIATFCLFAMVALTFSVRAQEVIQFQKIPLSDKRAQSDVLDIAEDGNGYLWLGTFQGLVRYDGLSPQQYTNEQDNEQSLSNNLVRTVHFSSQGDLWVGTQRGLNRYIPETDSFAHYLTNETSSQIIWGIFESPTGELFVSTNTNLFAWQPESNQFSPVFDESNAIGEIKTLHFTNAQKAIAGSYENGLYELDFIGQKVAPFDINTKFKEQHVQLYQLTAITPEQLWLTTSEGVYLIEKESLHLSPHAELFGFPVRSVLKATNGYTWVGTEQGLLVSQDDISFVRAQEQHQEPLINTEVFVYDIFEDSYENVWFVGPTLFGVHHHSADIFHQFHLTELSDNGLPADIHAIAASDFNLWLISNEGQFARWDPVTQKLYKQAQLHLNPSLNSHFRLAYDSKRQLLWLGSHDGLYSFSPSTQKLNHHEVVSGEQPLSREFNFKISPDGEIWIASKHMGLLRYSPELGKTDTFSIPSQFNSHLNTLELIDGKILLGTESGVLRFNPDDHKFEAIDNKQLKQKWITTIKSTDQHIWVGTLLAGAFKTDKNLNTLVHFNSENGLTDNTICAIVIDPNDDSSTWVVTNFGIAQTQGKGLTYRSFSLDSGISNKEFNHLASSISAAGMIYLGGVDGLTSFKSNQLVESNFNGKVQLTKLRVFNQVVEINGPQKRIASHISSLPSVNLSYQDSPFSIEFSYPYPAHRNNFKYAYRLIDLDNQWLQTDDSSPRATYTNLPPGQFIFEVKVQSKDGLWQSEPTRITINVAPPLWRTPPAYLAYAIVLIIILMLIAKQRQVRKDQQQKVVKSEERLKLSLWGSGDELWDWHITSGKIYRSNIWGLLEFPHDGRRNPQKGQQSNIHPRDLPRVQKALTCHFEGRSSYYEATYRVRNKSADWIWILDRGKIVEHDSDNNPLRMTGTIKDISKLKQAEERLALFARSVANISDGVFILNRRFRIVEINDAFSEITGFDKTQVMNHSLRFRSYPNSFSAQVKRRLSQQGRWVGELEELRANNEQFFVELTIDPIHSEEGDITHYVGVFSDITRRKQTEQELHRLSVEDTLTKLPNRSWFQAEHEKLVEKKTRHALMVLDLDNFKKINDSLGHAAGDELLQHVSTRLNQCTRRQDTLFRLGGDEYAVLMENTTDINTITKAAKAFQKALEAPFTIADRELVVTCSLGIVLYPLDGETSEELLRNADTAMYHAKSEGSNRYVFFSSQMNKSALHQLHIESLLRQAIRDDSFLLHYQPKFASATGELDGMEALIRLHHPEHGPVSPGEFIPLAEENGLIIEIGDIVLKKACFAAESWRRQGLMKGRIAVNVSAKQFSTSNLPERVKQVLELTALPAHFLELELTEGALIADPEGAIKTMKQLQDIGIHISLDDFGTGYSSLAYLQRFPIDTLKIDQTFIRNMTKSQNGRNMVASIVSLAHNLNLSIVAEGVETEQQRDLLTELQCESLQGFLMSRPLNETDFSAFLHIQYNQGSSSDLRSPEQAANHCDCQAD